MCNRAVTSVREPDLYRRTMRCLVLATLLLAACNSGDDGPSDEVADETTDADTTDVDADGTPVTCSGALYEECVMNEDCMSGICRAYNALGFSACTTACTPGDDSTCPAHPQGAAVTCNRTQAQCRPEALAACTP